MPSLRQKVTTYFRQLSFIPDSRDGPRSSPKGDNENFIIKYLEGRLERPFSTESEIVSGKNPSDFPELAISTYSTGPNTITAACTGPDDGLTGVKRSKLHFSSCSEIEFIDTIQEIDCLEIRKSISSHNKFKQSGISDNRKLTTTNHCATKPGVRSRKNSKGGIVAVESKFSSKNNELDQADSVNKSTTIVVSMVSSVPKSVTTDNNRNKNNSNDKIDITDPLTCNGSLSTVSLGANSSSEPQEIIAAEKKINDASRFFREPISNQTTYTNDSIMEPIAGVSNWKMESESAYGISVSLYENNILTKEPMGNPIADCYGMVVRGNASAIALADGVNWGDGARLAARSAVHGCLDYLDRAIFGLPVECVATSTQEVFVSLVRSLWEGHGCILEVGGALTTLTIAVVLPLAEPYMGKYVVCACNVGDSLGYIYSKKYGVREFTEGSHDILSMRDMRDALGALGPADGNKPELSNLTLSMTIVEAGDIIFLTSDGVSDNFDPVVGKFAEAWTPESEISTCRVLTPKRQNKTGATKHSRLQRSESTAHTTQLRHSHTNKLSSLENKLISSFSSSSSSSNSTSSSRPKYTRSRTVIEPRVQETRPEKLVFPPKIPRSINGLPLVTGPQRHALALYRLEDLLSRGINGVFSPCSSARRLCHLLIDFVRMITRARRKTLEQRELFYKLTTGPDGIKREVELNRMQHRAARKRVVDSSGFSLLPGKLDHATVVAYTVGSGLHSREFQETNF